jgi:hypothetical protein
MSVLDLAVRDGTQEVRGKVFEVADGHAAVTAMPLPDPLRLKVTAILILDLVTLQPFLWIILLRSFRPGNNRRWGIRLREFAINAGDLAA